MSEGSLNKNKRPIAKIGRFRGTKGEVVLHTYFDLSNEQLQGVEVEIRWDDGVGYKRTIERIWCQGKKTICLFEGNTTISDAQALCNGEVLIAQSHLSPLETNQYFTSDIIGLEVLTIDGKTIGKVKSLIITGGKDVLEVRGDREYLIPFAETIVVEVDLDKGQIKIDPPSGMLENNAN